MARTIRFLFALVGVVAVVATAAGAVFVTLMRSKDPRFVKRFTRLQRDVLNPEVLKNAGDRGQRTAVIETVGRRSGTAYATPITPMRDGDGWSVALVYGPETGWAKNALAAGEAVLRIDGARHRVDQIELVPIEQTALAAEQGRLMKVFRIEQAVRMRDAGPAPG